MSDVYLPFSSQEQVRCEAGQSQGSWRVIYSWFRNVLFRQQRDKVYFFVANTHIFIFFGILRTYEQQE